MTRLLTIDWDYFVPEDLMLDLGHRETSFGINTVWKVRALGFAHAGEAIESKVQTTGEERGFWDKIKAKFDQIGRAHV